MTADELQVFHRHFQPLFQRREQRAWSLLYLCGQLSNLERKTIEPMVLCPCSDRIPMRFVVCSGSSGKENQGHLFEDIHCLFEVDVAHDIDKAQHSYAQTINKGYGRLQIRECWVAEKEEYLALVRKHQNWKGLRSVVRIVSQRKFGEKVETQTRYFISSLPADAKTIVKVKRRHWKIENQVHWVLDTAFREDESRVRKDHSAENLTVPRHVALNLLRQEKTAKGGIHAKRLQAGWNNDYLLTILKG